MLVHISTPLPVERPVILALADRRPTDRQLEILKVIAAFRRRIGTPPTMRDIGEAVGIDSPNGVFVHLNTLERCRLVARRRNVARSVILTPLGDLVARGFSFGPPACVEPRAVRIDANLARCRRCPGCNRRGMSFVALHRDNEYAAVVQCPGCAAQEEV